MTPDDRQRTLSSKNERTKKRTTARCGSFVYSFKRHSLVGFFLYFGILCLLSAPLAAAQAPPPTSTPTPGMFPLPPGMRGDASINPRLAPPLLPENPTQADLGAQVYYQVCMVCHGDRGQGLTAEWRGVLDPEDQNCWQSGCHHTRRPEGGFIFPKVVPPVVGPDVLTHYPTALQLHDFIQARMPWQARGSRSDEEYWQLTAFLLRANGVDPGPEALDTARAAQIVLNPAQATALARPASAPTQTPTPSAASFPSPNLWWIGLGAAGLSFVAVFILCFNNRNKNDR